MPLSRFSYSLTQEAIEASENKEETRPRYPAKETNFIQRCETLQTNDNALECIDKPSFPTPCQHPAVARRVLRIGHRFPLLSGMSKLAELEHTGHPPFALEVGHGCYRILKTLAPLLQQRLAPDLPVETAKRKR